MDRRLKRLVEELGVEVDVSSADATELPTLLCLAHCVFT